MERLRGAVVLPNSKTQHVGTKASCDAAVFTKLIKQMLVLQDKGLEVELMMPTVPCDISLGSETVGLPDSST